MSISLKQRSNEASNVAQYNGATNEADLALSTDVAQLVKFIELNGRLPHRGKGGNGKAIKAAREQALGIAATMCYPVLGVDYDCSPENVDAIAKLDSPKQEQATKQESNDDTFAKLAALLDSNQQTVNHAFNGLTDMVTDKLEEMETKLSQRSNSNSNKQRKGTQSNKRSDNKQATKRNSNATKQRKRNQSGSKRHTANEQEDYSELHTETLSGDYGVYGFFARPYVDQQGNEKLTKERYISNGDALALLADLGQENLIDEDAVVGGSGSSFVDMLLDIVWSNEG